MAQISVWFNATRFKSIHDYVSQLQNSTGMSRIYACNNKAIVRVIRRPACILRADMNNILAIVGQATFAPEFLGSQKMKNCACLEALLRIALFLEQQIASAVALLGGRHKSMNGSHSLYLDATHLLS